MMFRARLEKALGPAASEVADGAIERLAQLDELLLRWGQAIRLVGFKSQDERDRRYFAEALALSRWLPAEGLVMDIGSGGGSPALPLAILRPSVEWTLVESNERKALFLEEAVHTLRLSNVNVVRARYEDLELTSALDAVTVRGVALGEKALEKIASELAPRGRLLWISSEARLAAGRVGLDDSWALVTGPTPLLQNGAFLLIAEQRE